MATIVIAMFSRAARVRTQKSFIQLQSGWGGTAAELGEKEAQVWCSIGLGLMTGSSERAVWAKRLVSFRDAPSVLTGSSGLWDKEWNKKIKTLRGRDNFECLPKKNT
jgi:hypothetical protein